MPKLVAKINEPVVFTVKQNGKAMVSQPFFEEELFVIVGSLDEHSHHPAANRIAGKRIRIEIYLEEDEK
jgi:hypothetical protein